MIPAPDLVTDANGPLAACVAVDATVAAVTFLVTDVDTLGALVGALATVAVEGAVGLVACAA